MPFFCFLQVELFDWQGEDLSDNGDGGIVRRVQTTGDGFTKPNEGASVHGMPIHHLAMGCFQRDMSVKVDEQTFTLAFDHWLNRKSVEWVQTVEEICHSHEEEEYLAEFGEKGDE